MRLFACPCDEMTRAGRADVRRRKLVTAARALFAQHGFHATGMAQLAAASGIKVGQIYRDFPSKKAIVGAIVEADLTAFLDEAPLRMAIAAGDRRGVEQWIADFICRHTDRSSELIPEICAESGRNNCIAAVMKEVDARIRGNLGAALGVFAPGGEGSARVAVAVDLVLTLAIGIASLHSASPDHDLSPLCLRIADLVASEVEGLARELV